MVKIGTEEGRTLDFRFCLVLLGIGISGAVLGTAGVMGQSPFRSGDSIERRRRAWCYTDQALKTWKRKEGRVRERTPAFSLWDQLFFNPVYLRHPAELLARKIGTEVTIGPCAQKPLKLQIPVLLGGMGYQTALRAEAKQALALGATMAGTATNTGNGPLLTTERSAAEKLIVQFARGRWDKDLAALSAADAVEIQLGHGPCGSMTVNIPPPRLARSKKLRALLGAEPGEPAVIPVKLLSIKDRADLAGLISGLRQKSGGVPVGVKIGASQRLEEELEIITGAQPDYIAIYGMEAGEGDPTAPTAQIGIPTLHAVNRAARYLRQQGLAGRISLLAGGGLRTPADFLKALALGADAVFIGTAALNTLCAGEDGRRFLRFSLRWIKDKLGRGLDIPSAAERVRDYLQKASREMQEIALCLGRAHLREVGKEDLSTGSKEIASCLGISWCGAPDLSGQRPLTCPSTKQNER